VRVHHVFMSFHADAVANEAENGVMYLLIRACLLLLPRAADGSL
jgi:hypothetical protein